VVPDEPAGLGVRDGTFRDGGVTIEVVRERADEAIVKVTRR
jgi:hypothetical protein